VSARRAALATGLVLLVAIAFAGVRLNDFVAFDDDLYVTANPLVRGGLTLDGVRRAFVELHVGNWHPLTWLSHMAGVELFGLEPAPHHVVNVGLHALAAALLMAALTAFAVWQARRRPWLLVGWL